MAKRRKIHSVGVYLRKSRGDKDEDILEKHRNLLVRTCEERGYDYKLYEEDPISGEELDTRPKMLELLADVEQGMYDGIMAVEIDRFVRNKTEDAARVRRVCLEADTLVMTPTQEIDLETDDGDFIWGFKVLIASEELKSTKRRYKRGKAEGAEAGDWTNGSPPYPYFFNRNLFEMSESDNGKFRRKYGKVEIDQDKLKTYNWMKEMYLEGTHGFEWIAFELNKRGEAAPSGAGNPWSGTAVERVLTHRFHLGETYFGRSKWRKRAGKKVCVGPTDPEDWSVGKGKHEPVKTIEEHERIMAIKASKTKVPHRSRAGTFPTSGIMYCKICGRRMLYSIGKPEVRNGGVQHNYCKCPGKSPTGEKCPQRGCKMDEGFYQAVFQAVSGGITAPKVEEMEEKKRQSSLALSQLESRRKELKTAEEGLARIDAAYIYKKLYTVERYEKLVREWEGNIKKIKETIAKLEKEISSVQVLDGEELEKRIAVFKNSWDMSRPVKELNDLLRSVVKRIEYDRNGGKIKFYVDYL